MSREGGVCAWNQETRRPEEPWYSLLPRTAKCTEKTFKIGHICRVQSLLQRSISGKDQLGNSWQKNPKRRGRQRGTTSAKATEETGEIPSLDLG